MDGLRAPPLRPRFCLRNRPSGAAAEDREDFQTKPTTVAREDPEVFAENPRHRQIPARPAEHEAVHADPLSGGVQLRGGSNYKYKHFIVFHT